MCDLPEQLALVLLPLAMPGVWCALKLQGEFDRILELRHPSVCASFGKSGIFKYDESPRESAAAWYLLAGSYVYLGDETLNTVARKARRVSLAALALLACGFMAMWLPT